MRVNPIQQVVNNQPQLQKKPTIHNVIILDASGSMIGSKFDNAVEGIREELASLKVDPNANYLHTVVTFNSAVKKILFASTNSGNNISFGYATGGTALYKTVGDTLTEVLNVQDPGQKVLVKIFTDGYENSSTGKFATKQVLVDFMEDLKKNHDFTITFIGTHEDVENIIDSGIVHKNNTLTHDNTGDSVKLSFATQTRATMTYAKAVADGVKTEELNRSFYSKSIK